MAFVLRPSSLVTHMDELLPYPFLALVGQPEMKTALVLALVNPRIGGVLLIGPYGVGKTTAVRALSDIMPNVEREERDEDGKPVLRRGPMRIVELPLNARLEDVVGGINERVALEQQRILLEEGVLSKAHRNLLYIDEINLLDARVIDAILDAAAQGRTFVRRGPMTRLYPSQFALIGSMNPEEGTLRPQILDRFGLRVWVAPLAHRQERLEVYRRARAAATGGRAAAGRGVRARLHPGAEHSFASRRDRAAGGGAGARGRRQPARGDERRCDCNCAPGAAPTPQPAARTLCRPGRRRRCYDRRGAGADRPGE